MFADYSLAVQSVSAIGVGYVTFSYATMFEFSYVIYILVSFSSYTLLFLFISFPKN